MKNTAPEAVSNVANANYWAGGKITVRIYTPQGTGPFPVIVYYHGGGWVIATIDTYDAFLPGHWRMRRMRSS